MKSVSIAVILFGISLVVFCLMSDQDYGGGVSSMLHKGFGAPDAAGGPSPKALSDAEGEIGGHEDDGTNGLSAVKKSSQRSRALNSDLNEIAEYTSSVAQDIAEKNIKSLSKKVAEKVVKRIASTMMKSLVKSSLGAAGGIILTALEFALGLIGDWVQRDKCKLLCCPKNNLDGSWACKYQTTEAKCKGYADYPGHGDHACFWNKAEDRCVAGPACRDKTFNFFAFVGSTCPECPNDEDLNEPQYSKAALKKAGLPPHFYVEERGQKGEYSWCPLKNSGVRYCWDLSSQDSCERSYADHDGDKLCQWYKNECRPGKECDNTKQREEGSKKLGLSYYHYAWRKSNGQPIDEDYCRYYQATKVVLAKCPKYGVGDCKEHRSSSRCNQGYMDWEGADRLCKWSGGRCINSKKKCHDGEAQITTYRQDESVCNPSTMTEKDYKPPLKVVIDLEKSLVQTFGSKKVHGKYPLLAQATIGANPKTSVGGTSISTSAAPVNGGKEYKNRCIPGMNDVKVYSTKDKHACFKGCKNNPRCKSAEFYKGRQCHHSTTGGYEKSKPYYFPSTCDMWVKDSATKSSATIIKSILAQPSAMAKCPSYGVGDCKEHKSRGKCNRGYMDWNGADRLCKWSVGRWGGRCVNSRKKCHD